ncbi:MAG: fused MFS/spermidine synthase [Firmicutes bacterium]|nr:fused MFS/spermidine synthase [Bacillota bacterium]
MAVELGASRLLAPYFSSSQIVWTIIIGTIMIAMALGNVFGGRWADKNSDPARLYRRILVASVWISFIPFAGRYIILGITGLLVVTVSTNLLIWAAFIACIVIFVFPLFLLGTVTPSLVKYTISDLGESGSVTGRLGAFNTVGSIIGTFLPTFVTIPAVGTAVTFLIFSGILLLIGLIYFIRTKTKKTMAIVMTVLFAIGSVLGNGMSFAFWENGLVYEGESIYNYLQVKDTEKSIILSTNVLFGVQSISMKSDSLTGMYYDYALAAPVMAGKDEPQVLILGMGSGTYASQLRKYYPDAEVTGVEIDQKITDLAYEYFGMPGDINVETYDGRAYLQADDKKYDIIMVDAYQDITIPFQMSSVEFFGLVRNHLTEDGIMVMNMNMHGSGDIEENRDITAYLTATVRSVFSNVETVDVPGTTNRELFASNGVDPLEALNGNRTSVDNDELRSLMAKVSGRMTDAADPGEAYVWTDDKAPVELIGMRTIDLLISDEVARYREIFREEGLKGLLG